ncbi:MAG: hypothetical protein Q7W05_15650 [Deltaproteobacteria bacterium]|nr:hypothetical protein [Deltaproteobacteria bacterium]
MIDNNLTSKTLKTGGLLAMASAFLSLPLAYLSFKLAGSTNSYANEIQTFIQTSGTLIFVTIILYLKRLLNSLFKFHDTDKNFGLMIIASMATGAVTIGIFSFPTLKESLETVVIAILVFQGIVQVQFGYKLLKLPDDLSGMLKPFCYANMATGILLASIILIPIGILASAISDLMLGTIFFNISKSLKKDM